MEHDDDPLHDLNLIDSYSRAQAIADGMLVDLSTVDPDLCGRHYKWTVACTALVWEIINEAARLPHHDIAGVLHDIMWMSRKNITRVVSESERLFSVAVDGKLGRKLHEFKIIVHGGDDLKPVITIMLPSEG